MDTVSISQKATHPSKEKASAGSPTFDWAVALLSAWMIGGLYLDGWAHHQGNVESFFTPWHAVLYTGFLAAAALLGGTFLRNVARGAARREALPDGYLQSLLGAAVFLVGGLGDMAWHILFGIEEGIEALLSPTHLLLAFGGSLLLTGPLRAAARRSASGSPGLPALISASLLLSVFAFFTGYAHPLLELPNLGAGPLPALRQSFDEPLMIAGILVQTGLMMAVVLFLLRHWKLPFGSLGLVFGLSTFLAVSTHENFGLALIGLAVGLAGDLLVWVLKPAVDRLSAFRWFAFALPVIYFMIYFLVRMKLGTIHWSVHMWTGAIVLAGLVGWLLSFAFIPVENS